MKSSPVLTHRHTVVAAGMAFDLDSIGEDAARARILAHYQAGDDVFRVGRYLVVIFHETRRMRCEEALGYPLVRQGRILSATPYCAHEVESSSREPLVIPRAGALWTSSIDEGAREELSLWFDITPWQRVTQTFSLGAVIETPKAELAPVSTDVRKTLEVDPMASETSEVLGSLIERAQRREPVAPRAGALLSALSFLGRLSSLFLRSSPDRGGDAALVRREIEPPSWFSRLGQGFRALLDTLLIRSRIASLFGRQHAKYLAKMLEMFERGDLDLALRHAIPLSGEVEAAFRALALRTPSPRENLAIVPHPRSAGPALGLGEDLFDHMKALYRRAFEELSRRGEHDKAAFVLSELLGANEEAVSYLERHGKLLLAAELAEARDLSPGLVVRQWFLAGDRRRAVWIARRTGAFAHAVSRLERSNPDEAAALRLLWADALASAGSYAAAVDAIWPVQGSRHLALHWMDRAIAVGGATSLRMLVRKLRVCPEEFVAIRDRIGEILDVHGTDTAMMMDSLAQEILSEQASREIDVIASMNARALLMEGGALKTARRLVEKTGDAVLRADLMAWKEASTPTLDIHVSISASTQTGASRNHNEDSCFAVSLDHHSRDDRTENVSVQQRLGERGVLFGVFDGTGGIGVGRRASELVAKTVLERMRTAPVGDEYFTASSFEMSFQEANRQLHRFAVDSREGGGSTATVGLIRGRTLFIAHVGDTRAYLLRSGVLSQLTRDHSLLNQLIDTGQLRTQEEIENFAHARVILRAMGSSRYVDVDVYQLALCAGDMILLTSNGVHQVVDPNRLGQVLRPESVPGSCDGVISVAAEGPDDITAVVVKVTGSDLPAPPLEYSPPVAELVMGPSPHIIHRPADDIGAMHIHDAVELPDGRLLVALGEIGAAILSSAGKMLIRFREPAMKLVMSDHGDRAILAAKRGEAWRLARLDVIDQRVESWCDARIDGFADDFDGSIWYVSQGKRLFAIDATSGEWEQIWEFDAAGRIDSIARDVSELAIYSAEAETVSIFSLPSNQLHRAVAQTPLACARVFSGGALAGLGTDGRATIAYDQNRLEPLPLSSELKPSLVPFATGAWAGFITKGEHGAELHVVAAHSDRCLLVLQLDSPSGKEPVLGARVNGERLIVFDAFGRLMVISLTHRELLKDLRIS